MDIDIGGAARTLGLTVFRAATLNYVEMQSLPEVSLQRNTELEIGPYAHLWEWN